MSKFNENVPKIGDEVKFIGHDEYLSRNKVYIIGEIAIGPITGDHYFKVKTNNRLCEEFLHENKFILLKI